MIAELLPNIKGKIVPAFSWNNTDEFLSKGKGYCIVNGDKIAAWAFSATISSKEIDIGIETNAEYQNRGFASIFMSQRDNLFKLRIPKSNIKILETVIVCAQM